MPRLFSKEDREYILKNPDNLTRAELSKKFGVSEASITNLIYNSTHQNKIKEALKQAGVGFKKDGLHVYRTFNQVHSPNATLVLNGVSVNYDSNEILVKVRTDTEARIVVDICVKDRQQ